MSAIPSTSPLPLNRYLSENPSEKARSYNLKRHAFNVAMAVQALAIVAIMGVVFAVSYGALALVGPIMSAALIGSVLGTIPLTWGATYCAQRALECKKFAQTEKGVAEELKQISNWGPEQIEIFFQEQDLGETESVKTLLPLQRLLPLIARFNYLQKRAEQLKTTFQREVDHPNHAAGLERFTAHQGRWDSYVDEQIPTLLNAAVVLEMIKKPFNSALHIEQPSHQIPHLGKCQPHSFVFHLFDRAYPSASPMDRPYFEFHKDLRRSNLTLAQIEADLSPKALRRRLF